MLAIQNKRWFAAVWLAATLVFLLVVHLALYIRNNDTVRARRVSEGVIAAILADDTGRAYADGSRQFRLSVTEEKLGQVIDQVGPYLRGAVITETSHVASRKSGDGRRTVLVYTAARTKSKVYIQITVVREDGEWRLQGLQSATEPMPARLE